MNIDDIIENIKNDYYRKLIKNIFSKLDDEEIYVLLELNNQLQDKINKIDKAIEHCKSNMFVDSQFIYELLAILGDKE